MGIEQGGIKDGMDLMKQMDNSDGCALKCV